MVLSVIDAQAALVSLPKVALAIFSCNLSAGAYLSGPGLLSA
jgi:hypothetical protein